MAKVAPYHTSTDEVQGGSATCSTATAIANMGSESSPTTLSTHYGDRINEAIN